MKKLILTIIASVGLVLTIGCGGHGGGGSSATDGTVGIYGGQCQPWQIYSTELARCLEPQNCPTGMGYNPDNGRCYPGTLGGAGTPTGSWANGMTITNANGFAQLMKDIGQCRSYRHMSTCSTTSWLYIQLTVQNGNSPYMNAGIQSQFPGFYGSSAFYVSQSNYMGSQNRTARVRMQTGSSTSGTPVNLQFTSSVYAIQGGFEVRVRPSNTSAYQERIVYRFTYNNTAASQLHMQLIYKGQVLAEGDVNQI